MPRGDRTGPLGMGPMTGRRAGYCAGAGVPGYANPYAWGGGWGGRGYRHWYYATGLPGWARFGNVPVQPWAPAAAPSELDALRDQAQWLKGQLDAIGKRISELEPKE
jgi:hypothetical protein